MVMFFIVANASAVAAITDIADMTSSSVINYNGNDSVVLLKATTPIDSIGQNCG